MALKAGRKGLHKSLVDAFGFLKGEMPTGDYYTKTQTDNKFETKTHANNTFQKQTLEVPIEMLYGTKLTVEDALQGLNEEKFTYADNGVLGAKNLLKNTATNMVLNGITWTVNANGSVTVDGTATADSYFVLWHRLSDLPLKGFEHGKEYILSGDAGLGTGNGYVYVNFYTGSTRIGGFYTLYSSDGKFTIPDNADYIDYGLGILNGKTVNNFTFYPMCRLATDPDDTYVPYAMTNRELTEKVFEKRVLSSEDDLNNIMKTGLYGITTSPTNSPENLTYCTLIVQSTSDGDLRQMVYKGNGNIYIRSRGGSPTAWGTWFKFTGTVVS